MREVSPGGAPRPGGIVRPLAWVFVATLALYAAGFVGLERWRQRRGPWEMTFATGPDREPLLVVNQRRLGIVNVRLVFPDQHLTNRVEPATLVFDHPSRRGGVPFGRVVFLDTTFLPGTVTVELFGHQIELLPRALIVNKQRRAWRSGEEHRVQTPPARPAAPAGR